jgi:pentatricopeptide repeat protein
MLRPCSFYLMPLILAFAEAGFPDVKPNTRTFNAVLDCLSRVGEGERAEALLYHMLNRYRSGDNDAKPDSFSFNW